MRALAETAASLGLECWSIAVGSADVPNYQLSCSGSDPSAHAEFHVQAYYWTLDGVSDLDVQVSPDALETAIEDSSVPRRVILPLVGMVAGTAAREWVELRIDDQACDQGGCSDAFDGVAVAVQWGFRGSRGLNVAAE